ncbi:MAG: hypothetical protein KJ578_14145 [Bacteroidetes bacterium]|nr:hypothetical protein [Bacteroidota bacterium]
MKYLILISLLLLAEKIDNFNKSENLQSCSKIVEVANEIGVEQNPEKLNQLEEDFFSLFPKTFEELVSCYGYTDIPLSDTVGLKSTVHFSPLYYQAEAHIDIYYSLKNISTKRLIHRIVDISMNGHWQADAVNIFKHGYRTILKNNLEEFLIYLASFEYSEIESFWYFYFDGPCPEDDIPDYLKPIKSSYPDIYEAMLSAATKVKLEWKNY